MSQNEVMVSVIMPVYNAVEYVGHTIQSILDQSYTNFELILVDDGATDGSGAICDQYSQKDPRIHVIHQKNGGICHARNTGLDLAIGKYIAFCDHDDEMLPDCLEKTVSFAEKENLDMVRFSRRHIAYSELGKVVDCTAINEKEIVTMEAWDSYIYIYPRCSYGVWAGIYKREYLKKNNIRFEESIRYGYEDVNFSVKSCEFIKRVGILPDVLYAWITRSSISTSRKISLSICRNRLAAVLLWKEKEDNIGDNLGRTIKQTQIRATTYLEHAMGEICALDIPEKEKKKLYQSVKLELLDGMEPQLERPHTIKSLIKYICVLYDFVWLYGKLQRVLIKRKTINANI